MEPQEKKHIVMLPFPAQGHQTPMMRLACRLASIGGVKITFVTNEWFVESAVAARKRGCEELIQIVGISKGAVAEEEMKGNATAIALMMKTSMEMEEPFEQQLKIMIQQGLDIHCILTDAYMDWPQDVADKLGIPRASLWTSSTAAAIFALSFQDFIDRVFVPVQDKVLDLKGNITIDWIPGLENMHITDQPFNWYHPVSQENMNMRAKRFERMNKTVCILFNTIEELDKQAIEGLRLLCPNVLSVGPLLPNGPNEGDHDYQYQFGSLKEDRTCLEWLEKQGAGSVVYISFGSLANMSARQMEALYLGLEESGAPYLWVVRPNLIEGNDDTTSDAFQSFLLRTQSRGMVVTWAPQLEVLSHVAVSLFLTHCGWNSTVEAIWHGVPILAWPCFAEQNVNARLVVSRWRVGIAMSERVMEEPGAFVQRDEVAESIRLGRSHFKIKDNMSRAMKVARKATQGSSLISLRNFIEMI